MKRLPGLYQRQKIPVYAETGWILSGSGKTKKAQKNYQNFAEGVEIKAAENPAQQLTEGLILGDRENNRVTS